MRKDRIIDGKFIRLEEIQPRHFNDVIKWRNNPELNKFLNQPFKLTLEKQTKWYEEIYLKDDSQGMFIMVDKSNNKAFATIGWTDYIQKENIVIAGRALAGEAEYRASKELTEGYLLLNDYLYETYKIKIMYIHVADDNKKVISLNKRWGYKPNKEEIRFPSELFVNGFKQTEYTRSYEEYMALRQNFVDIINSF